MNMNFNQVEMVLFDSTIAQFKLSVKGTFTRDRNDGSTANLVYKSNYTNTKTNKVVTTLNINPNIYLVFGYRGETYETSETLYTSFPQLFKIRESMEIIKDLMLDPDTFEEIEGILEVKSEFQDYITIEGIGRDNNWISFGVATVENIDPNSDIRNKVPGATIQISSSKYASPLTAEEFLTIYTIVKDIDLSSIQLQLTLMAALSDNDSRPTAYQQPAPQYQQPAPQYQQPTRQAQYQQPAPRGAYQQPAAQPSQGQQPAQAKYGNNPRSTFKPRQTAPVTRPQPNNENESSPYDHIAIESQPQGQTRNNLPPRKGEKPIVNMKAVQDTPVAEIDFNDPEAINNIFKDEE
jgi:hypothetical protein